MAGRSRLQLPGWSRAYPEPTEGGDFKGLPPGLGNHPHFAQPDRKNNRVYLADSPAEGGIFPRFSPDLQLTAPGCPRSRWRLPGWFYPHGRTPLSYHHSPKRWQLSGEFTHLQTAPRGQEFVLDLGQYPEAATWLEKILTHS